MSRARLSSTDATREQHLFYLIIVGFLSWTKSVCERSLNILRTSIVYTCRCTAFQTRMILYRSHFICDYSFQKAMIKDLASEAQKFGAKRVPLGPEDNAERDWFIISLILLLGVG